ncbi:putative molybdenum carrier protein [Castellaniella defragrans]|uniref:putative molybdenum carrier protein n=1 Tax=Castellaniella defragrans TaxID=75697 RepID=UPI000A02B086|nr:putative molybdenum carrier protein [Castellaniella defragrans]
MNQINDAAHQLIRQIISGGQTGADRAALDFAIEHGYSHGGWAPRGREAEDGPIPLKYQLSELADGGYRQRNKRNVRDSDGTLIVNIGTLDGGTLATQVFAQKLKHPYFLAQLDIDTPESVAPHVIEWLRTHTVSILNVAGPRESKRPGVYKLTRMLLEAIYLDQ